MRPWYAVETAQMSLSLVPAVLDPVDVGSAIREQLRMVNPHVVKIGNVQHIIAPPAVRINNAVGHDLAVRTDISVLPEASSMIFT